MRKAVANAIKEMADQQLVDSEKQMAELRQQLGKTAAELAAALQQVQKLRMLEVRLEEDITRERQRNQELEELNGRLRRARGLAAA
jgi:DNA repair exonuclease SbcCD ATPase subunit